MSKIEFKNKKGKITIINKLLYPETVNERVCNIISSGILNNFLPVSVYQKRKETRVECVVQNLITFDQYFNDTVTKKMFLDFVNNISTIIINCEDNMINANNIDLQNDKIFIDPQSKSVKCIYWPVVNNQRGVSPHLFLKQLPYELNFAPYEDKKYLEVYKDFFNGDNPFSVKNFAKLVSQLSGQKITNGHIIPSESLSKKTEKDTKINQNEVDSSKNDSREYNPFDVYKGNSDVHKVEKELKCDTSSVYCPSCGFKNKGGYNFCMQCGTKFIDCNLDFVKPKVNETTVLGDNYRGTTILSYEPKKVIFPTLKRLSTNEIFTIDKPVFRIGKEERYVDYFINDNSAISRSHADIITNNGRYFIKDRNSTNHTFIDGNLIQSEIEYEIFSGNKIRLADEDFEFKVY